MASSKKLHLQVASPARVFSAKVVQLIRGPVGEVYIWRSFSDIQCFTSWQILSSNVLRQDLIHPTYALLCSYSVYKSCRLSYMIMPILAL